MQRFWWGAILLAVVLLATAGVWRWRQHQTAWMLVNHTSLPLVLAPAVNKLALPEGIQQVQVIVQPKDKGLPIALRAGEFKFAALAHQKEGDKLTLSVYSAGQKDAARVARLNLALMTAWAYSLYPDNRQARQAYIKKMTPQVRRHPWLVLR